MTTTAIIIGLAAVSYIMFDLWITLRERHATLALFFFITGIASTNILTFSLSLMMRNDPSATYLSGLSNILFQFVMWLSIIVAFYVITMTFAGFIISIINAFSVWLGYGQVIDWTAGEERLQK